MSSLLLDSFPTPPSDSNSTLSFLQELNHLLSMRSFAAIFTILSLPLYVFAANYGNRGDNNIDMAVRARGDVLQKRDSGRFTWYDITTGV